MSSKDDRKLAAAKEKLRRTVTPTTLEERALVLYAETRESWWVDSLQLLQARCLAMSMIAQAQILRKLGADDDL
jgi:hypothetical protein